MTKKVPMTREGYEKIKKELDHLMKVERPKNIRDIEEATSTPRSASWSTSLPMPRSSMSRN
jgi:hypothetical protein